MNCPLQTLFKLRRTVSFLAVFFLSNFLLQAQSAYITNQGDGTVSVIDLRLDAVVHTITVGGDPTGVSSSSDGSTIYVGDIDNNFIFVIDAASNTVIDTIVVGNEPAGITLSSNDSTLYVANSDDNTISVVNTATHTVTNTRPLPFPKMPWLIL